MLNGGDGCSGGRGGLTAGEQAHVESAGTNSSTSLHSAIYNGTMNLYNCILSTDI